MLLGLALGFRLNGAIAKRSNTNNKEASLPNQVQTSPTAEGAVNLSLNVTKCSPIILENQIAMLIKTGHTVSVVRQCNQNTVTLKIKKVG